MMIEDETDLVEDEHMVNEKEVDEAVMQTAIP